MLDARGESLGTGGADLVIAPRRPLVALGDGGRFPPRSNVPSLLQASENRVHRPARQSRGVHDVEAVANAIAKGFEHSDGGERDGSVHGWPVWLYMNDWYLCRLSIYVESTTDETVRQAHVPSHLPWRHYPGPGPGDCSLFGPGQRSGPASREMAEARNAAVRVHAGANPAAPYWPGVVSLRRRRTARTRPVPVPRR